MDKCLKSDTVLNKDKDMETLGSDDVNQEERNDENLKGTSINNDEETREYYCRWESFLDTTQERGKDIGEYYTSMQNQWMQAYPSEERNLVEFKIGLIQGLDDLELMEQSRVFKIYYF